MTLKNWTFNLGVEGRSLQRHHQRQPGGATLGHCLQHQADEHGDTRLLCAHAGNAIQRKPGARQLGCNDAVINDLMSACRVTLASRRRWSPAGAMSSSRACSRLSDGTWSSTANTSGSTRTNAYDFSVLGNTPITFPIEWQNSKIPGYAFRASVPNFHGFSAFVVFSGVAARFFEPAGQRHRRPRLMRGRGVPHRPRPEIQATAHLQYQPSEAADRGLASTGAMTAAWLPARCLAREAIARTARTALIRSWMFPASLPDQQFQAGLFCGGVRATPTSPISPDGTVRSVAIWIEPGEDSGCGHRR